MKTLFVNQITPGVLVSGETFAIFDVKNAEDKNGKPYCDLVLMDKTGQIGAKIWSDVLATCDRNSLKAGKVVMVDARVESFRGKTQLTIIAIKEVQESVMDDYLESSIFPAEEMFAELQEIISTKIHNKHLQNMFESMFEDAELARRFKYWPAALSYHHDFRSGLLQHIMECLALAEGMERFYPDVDFDMVRAGIIMHDVGKLEEIDASGMVPRFSVKGSVLGHLYIGAEMVDKYLAPECPEKIKLHLKHIILSHHGERAKGSPVLPSTPEALMVSGIDEVSAKARMGDKGAKEASDELGMTGYNRWLERWMWAGSRVEEPSSDTLELPLGE